MKNATDKGGAAAEKNGSEAKDNAADATKYRKIDKEHIVAFVRDAADMGIRDIDFAERVRKETETTESEDHPGTWFVSLRAKTWRDAMDFVGAIIGGAVVHGLYANVSADWDTGLAAKGGGRFICVFVATDSFMDKPEVERGMKAGHLLKQQTMKTIKELGVSPAPWAQGDDIMSEDMVLDADGETVAEQMDERNARLAAAAPDLYDACRMALGLVEGHATDNRVLAVVGALRFALGKAGGAE